MSAKTLKGIVGSIVNFRNKQWEKKQYRYLIDHILVSRSIYINNVNKEAHQFQYSNEAIENYRISDHCPIYFKFH